MFGFGKKKGLTLGLEVTSSSISILQMEASKLGVELVKFATAATPPNTVTEGLIADPNTVGAIVQECLGQAGLLSGGAPPVVNTIVPGQSVVIRLMPVPAGMPADELADVVMQEAINHVPFPLKEANLDWSIMPATQRTDPDGVTRVDVILAAVTKAIVDSYWRLCESAGLKLGRLDISSLATIRALSFAGCLNEMDRLFMSVNIRQEATDINLIRSGMPLFTRSVLLGLDTVGEAVCRSLEINAGDALAMLPQIQLFGVTSVEPRAGQAAQIARTVFGDITDEVGRSLEFYRSQVGDVNIEQIFLSGPGCLVPQLDEFISSRLNVKTVLVNPFHGLTTGAELVPPEQVAGQTMLAGCLIQSDWAPVITVDLDLNKEGPSEAALSGGGETITHATVQVVEEETPWFLPVALGGVASLLLVAGLWVFLSQFDLPGKQAEITRLTGQIENEKKQVADLGKIREDNALLQQKRDILNGIVKHETPWAVILKSIADNTPKGVQIKHLAVSGGRIKIEGDAVDFARVSDLVVNLSGSPLLQDSSVTSARRNIQEDPRVVGFEIETHLNPAGINPSIASGSSLQAK